ncbi:MAG: NAD(P)-dependent alcohol dehydrogenase [Solirubrobacteraceae bacterium]
MSVIAAIVQSEGGPFELRDVQLDELRDDEVLVEVAACGICHTDLSVRDQILPGPLPIVLGHEGAGVVTRVGSAVRGIDPGDRVALSFNSCGACPACAVGLGAHCHETPERNFFAARPDGTTAISCDGRAIHSHFFGQSTFATEAVVAARTVVKIDADVPFELVAPFGCGVQTGAGTVLNTLRPHAGSAIAVFGAGCVGMSAIMAARLAGCTRIVAVDVNPSRLELAGELGATHAIDASQQDPVEAIREITGGGANYAIDASGVPEALRQAVDCTTVLGVTASVGSPPIGSELKVDIIAMIMAGKTVLGVAEGRSLPEAFLPRLIELWRDGRFPVDRIIESFPFERINEAAAAAASGEVIKPVLSMR